MSHQEVPEPQEETAEVSDPIERAASETAAIEDLQAFLRAATRNPEEVRTALDTSPWSAVAILRLHALRDLTPLGRMLVVAMIDTGSSVVLESLMDPWTFEDLLIIDGMSAAVFPAIERTGQLDRFLPVVQEHVHRAFLRMVEDMPNYWKGTVDILSHARKLSREIAPLPPQLRLEAIAAINEAGGKRYKNQSIRVWADTEARWMKDHVLRFLTAPDCETPADSSAPF
jgi:hypothetical protein